ncbi:DUF3168 domain-containing protein [Sphingomicrobium sp. XHP0239]|uniref:tail completion protein gp17 n=1 Tax=Sphingomicrobium maritimum TaxID=3133972 RepID=UPI0031CC3EAD
MSAGAALQAAIVRALEPVDGLSGIYDGPPARAAYPYVAVDARDERDWGHKTGAGREVLAAVTVWDDVPARLEALIEEVEPALAAIGPVEGWQLVTLNFVKRGLKRDVAGPWAGQMDFRARLLAAPEYTEESE